MCFTIDQIEQACGLLLLTEFNTFVYCCKRCQCEFESGSNLELHILSEHQDNKEAVFVHENVFVDNFKIGSTIKEEQFVVNTEVLNEPNVEEQTIDDVKPPTILLVNENLDNDNSSIETNKVKDEVPFDETTEKHLEENVEPGSSNMEMGTIYEESKRKHPPKSKASKTDVNPIEKVPKGLKNRKTTVKTKITNEPMAFYCDMCPDLSFKYKQSLLRHMNAHHIYIKFKCDFCDATFTQNTTRVIHMRIHTGEKPFLCSICGKDFNSKSRCYTHETSVHKTVKKHKCQQCDRSFNTRGNLQDHINAIHTKERPHVCDICGKNYAARSTLQMHKSTHSEARLKCRYCDMPFKIRSNRWEHEMVFHKKVVMVGDKIINMYKKKNRLKMEMYKKEAQK